MSIASASDPAVSSRTSRSARAQLGKWVCASVNAGRTQRPRRSTLSGVGSAASCDQYAVKVKKQVCARYYRTKFSDDRGPLIEERLKLAEALVSGATGKVGNLREAQAFTERIDRIYALRGRLTSAVLVLSTLSQKQQGAPVKAGTKKIK